MVIEHPARSHVSAQSHLGLDMGVHESRLDVHPRFTVNWAALGTMLGTAFVCLIIGLWLGATITMGVMVDRSLNMGPSLPPCPTEDSVGCFWDADTMGNGRGHDVVTLP